MSSNAMDKMAYNTLAFQRKHISMAIGDLIIQVAPELSDDKKFALQASLDDLVDRITRYSRDEIDFLSKKSRH